MRTFVVIVLSVACAASIVSQQLSSQTKAREIAAAFTKNKHAVKEKFGVRVEKYKDVRSEPAVKSNLSEYSGVYEVHDLGYVISVQVGNDGRIQANGSENSRTFTLENAKIDGALLTATKVYSDGTRERFEGSFLNRTDRNSPTDPGVTIFGLGVVLTTPFEVNGLTYDKLFYQLK
jgi:hypothetical protein